MGCFFELGWEKHRRRRRYCRQRKKTSSCSLGWVFADFSGDVFFFLQVALRPYFRLPLRPTLRSPDKRFVSSLSQQRLACLSMSMLLSSFQQTEETFGQVPTFRVFFRNEVLPGDDMTGEGHTRAVWNRVLITEVIAPSYVRFLLFAASKLRENTAEYFQLWPVLATSEPWASLQRAVYTLVSDGNLFPADHPVKYLSLQPRFCAAD